MDVSQELAYRQVTEHIIGAAMEVHRTLKVGFLEKVYENALVEELRSRGLQVEQQKAVTVYYKGTAVGDYVADLVVNGVIREKIRG